MKVITVTSDKFRRSRKLSLIRNKLLLFLALLVCFAFFTLKPVFAQDASNSGEVVKKYKITFPVAELGNCASLEECRAYCADSTNQEACVSFAKKKGFYKAPKPVKPNFQQAKEILGCNSPETCKVICQLEENRGKCSEFAKVNGLKGGLRPASESGKFTPNSERAYEHANEQARFCREYPERCKSTSGNASGSANLEQGKMGKPEMEKKLMEKRELEKKELMEKKEIKQNSGQGSQNSGPRDFKPNESKTKDGKVQGVSTSPSFFNWVFDFFFQ